MIEWLHTGTVLRGCDPDNRRRGMIVKKISGSSVAHAVFVDSGVFAGSHRTLGYAKELCRKELES